jgi:hypothetical protein
MIAYMTESERSERGVLKRAGWSAAVGGVALILGVIVGVVGVRVVPCEGGGLECLGTALIVGVAALVAAAIVAWIGLHLIGVRPAWPVALLGPPAALAAGRIGDLLPIPDDVLPGWLYSVGGLSAAAAFGYLAAALVTDRRIPGWPRLALVLSLAAPALILHLLNL